MKITIDLKGEKEKQAFDCLMAWIVDGGGEDILSQTLYDNDINVDDFDFDMDKGNIIFKLED
ncbi:MAG: hypothetical protein M0R46_01285 [Candidatus Muirbacterium halophilum]|nr:hypothetical protein [Candidatus Muirbacterium halophilum]MCK9474527.1 hypothetical protein [Candidatus Muirbacterium halophilum]